MKVIAFNGSPHTHGVIAKGISIIKTELEKECIETEVMQIGSESIRGCCDCRKCRAMKHCAISGDPVNEAFEKMQSVDGVILGSPVYYGSIAGTMKCFLDRLFFPGPNMKYKVGAAVASLRRTGGISTYHQLNNYFNLAQMIITPGVYWNVIHGNNPDEAAQDMEGMQIMEIQGRNMAWLIKSLAYAREKIPLPAPVTERIRTNFIH